MSLIAHPVAADTLKYGLVNPPTHISVDMSKKFSEFLSARTGGKLTVEAFPAQQLVRSDNWFQGVRLGTVDFASGAISLMEGLAPEITILDAPYLFKDLDHARRVLDGDFTNKLNEKLIKSGGVRILAWWLFGVRHLATTIPVKSPADLAGKKVRDVPSPVLLATLEGMGANPVPLDWGEVYTALQTGAVVGIVNPPDLLFNAGLFEVLKYLALTGHTTMVQAIVMNERKFQSYPPDVRAAIQESAKLAADWQWQTAIAQEKDFIEKLRSKGMTIVTESDGLKVSEFAAKAHSFVVNKYVNQWGKPVYDEITDAGKKK
jgi:tripartite ATP-independent transporter DctP family solute receptor